MIGRRRDDGAIAVIVALLAVVLFGFAALVVDIGHAQQVRSQAQNAADAAALAGVRELAHGQPTSAVVDTVKAYVKANTGITDWASCTDDGALDASNTCISTSTTPSASGPAGTSYQVRVKLPDQHVAATFGGLFGVSSIKISPLAQALSGQPQSPPCGPCHPVLDGVTNQPTPPEAALTQDLADWLPDPANTTVTPVGNVGPDNCPTGPGLFSRAAFPSGITMDTSCNLTQGVYVFDDTDLTVDAGAELTTSDVTLVFYGRGKLAVEGTLSLTASPAGPPPVRGVPGVQYPGVALVLAQYKSNPAPNRTFELGPGFQISGSVYALDDTKWHTDSGDCPPPSPPAPPVCKVDPGDLAVTATDFARDIVPNVAPQVVLPPQPPHLVK